MSKKCNSCGAELEDDVLFCDKCGAKQEAPVTMETTVGSDAPVPGMSRNTIIAIAACGVAAVVVVIILASLLLGGGYKKAVKAQFKALNKNDAEKIIKTLPDDYLSIMDDVHGDDYEKYLDNQIDNVIEEYEDKDRCGKNLKFSYEIVGKIKYTDDEIDDMIDSYEDNFDEEIDIKKGYILALKTKVKGDKDTEESFTQISVIKIDGKWVALGGFIY